MRRLYALPMLALAALPACANLRPVPAGAASKKNPAMVIVNNGDRVPNLTPPQQLAIRWPGSDGIEQDKLLAECDDMGGELVWAKAVKRTPGVERKGDWAFQCEKVDY